MLGNRKYLWVAIPLTLVLVWMALPNFIPMRGTDCGRVGGNRAVHALQVALERYAVDHGVYPGRIGRLWEQEYLGGPLRNPYTDGNLRVVPYGAPDSAGNCTYLPFRIDGEILGYYLIAYARPGEKGHDIDNDGMPDGVEDIRQSAFFEADEAGYPPADNFDEYPTLEEVLAGEAGID